MKKTLILLVIIFAVQWLFGDVFIRAGMSSTTGMLGLEYRINNISIGSGIKPLMDDVMSIAFGATYFFSVENSFYVNGSYMIDATIVDANDDSKGTEDFYGFVIGYRYRLSDKFDIRAGLGLGNSTITNETGLNIDATLGYRF